MGPLRMAIPGHSQGLDPLRMGPLGMAIPGHSQGPDPLRMDPLSLAGALNSSRRLRWGRLGAGGAAVLTLAVLAALAGAWLVCQLPPARS
eukprot:5366136-Alexandrium_andersonii.AAC.1